MHAGSAETTSKALQARRAVASGTLLGPRIYTAGDVFPIWRDTAAQTTHSSVLGDVPDSSSLRVIADSIRRLKAAGHDFLKLYGWPRPLYDSAVVAARRVGLRVVGHVPSDVGIEDVLRDHWASVEHLTGYGEYILGLSGRWSTTHWFGLNHQSLVDTA